MLKRAIALGLFLVAPAAMAEPIWVGDFETGDWSQWSSEIDVHEGTTDRVQVVTEPVAQGRFALKTTVRHGDINNNGSRAEVVLREPMFHQGDDVWFHWFTMFPEDYQPTEKWVLYTQWHSSGFGVPLGFNLHDETLSFRVMGHEYDRRSDWTGGTMWEAQLERGKWMEFLLHVKFSDADDGFIEVWKDGEQIVAGTNHPTLDPGDYVYLKQGLYRDKSIPYDMTIYHDGMTAYSSRPDEVFARWEGGGADDGGSETPDPADDSTDTSVGCGEALGLAALLPMFGLGRLLQRLRRGRNK